MKHKSKKAFSNVESLLEDIKRLLILQLYKYGASTHEIGSILDVSYKTVERIIPKNSKLQKYEKTNS